MLQRQEKASHNDGQCAAGQSNTSPIGLLDDSGIVGGRPNADHRADGRGTSRDRLRRFHEATVTLTVHVAMA